MTDILSCRKQCVTLNGVSSDWTSVTSGVPQGSVLGPLLFIIYINDLPDVVKSHCKLFADDAKLYKQIANVQDFEAIQEDLFELCRWTLKWQLFFNLNKCKVLHIGQNNPQYSYKMTDMKGTMIDLQCVDNEKDLGIIFQSNLKFDQHISMTVNKANKILGLIKRTFSYLDKNSFLCLYKSLVRSHLDYGDSIWFPVYKKDIRIIENIQRRATRLLPQIKHLSYKERLKELNLSTLMYRRRRGDLIKVFKILNGIDDIAHEEFFQMADSTTRGHSKKLFKPRSSKAIRYNSFAIRIVDEWNSLPDDIVTAKSVLQFKTKLDKHWINKRFDDTEIY